MDLNSDYKSPTRNGFQVKMYGQLSLTIILDKKESFYQPFPDDFQLKILTSIKHD